MPYEEEIRRTVTRINTLRWRIWNYARGHGGHLAPEADLAARPHLGKARELLGSLEGRRPSAQAMQIALEASGHLVAAIDELTKRRPDDVR